MESRQGAAVAATVSLELVQDWLDLLRRQQVDFTLAWRRLRPMRLEV